MNNVFNQLIMKTTSDHNQKHNLYILDDARYALRIKLSLAQKFGEELNMHVFQDANAAFEALERDAEKPLVILMDHAQNRQVTKSNGKNVLNLIQKISPETRIVVLSDEANKEKAFKLLAEGAHDFVLKDGFDLMHIHTAVEKCFHPALV
jgi:DNA-binding NarL/FixJ family response regulator